MDCIEMKIYNDIIEECFATDKDLCDKWHIEAPNTAGVCSKRTVNDLQGIDGFKFYSLIENNEIAGFFGSYVTYNGINYMAPFFLKNKYRSMKNEFWAEVNKKMGNMIYTGVHNKNERAKKFLDKYGSIEFKTNEGVIYKINLPCHL